MMVRLLHLVNAALFSGIGIAFLVSAENLGRKLGIQPLTAQGLTDFRATYGGFCLGVGVFFALAATHQISSTAALAASVAIYLGFGLSRLFGMFIDQSFTPMMWSFLGFETVMTLWSALALRSML